MWVDVIPGRAVESEPESESILSESDVMPADGIGAGVDKICRLRSTSHGSKAAKVPKVTSIYEGALIVLLT